MIEAVGAYGYLAYDIEDSWGGGIPGSPNPKKLKAMTPGMNLRPNIAPARSSAVNSKRSLENARGGDITVSGQVPFEIPLLGLGRFLKCAIGPVTTGMDVEKTSGDLTGITAIQAEDGATSGAGTLSLSGSDLTWAAQGDTAGSAVDVSSEGYYTLESSTDGSHLIVYSDGSPGGSSDTITVSATKYKHRIKRGALSSMVMEVAYTDISQYQLYKGCKIDNLSLDIPESGMITGSAEVIGKSADDWASSVNMSNPSEVEHVPFMDHEAAFEEGGSSVTLAGFGMQLANALNSRPVPGSRTIASLVEGRADQPLMFSPSFLFEDATYADKVANETESSLKATLSNSDGTVEFYAPKGKYFGDYSAGIQTEQGILLPLSFIALYDDIEESDIVVSIVNTESSL